MMTNTSTESVTGASPFTVVDGQGRTLTLFHLDEGGAQCWVLALDAKDAVEVLIDLYGYEERDDADCEEDLGWSRAAPPRTVPASPELAERTTIRDEDGRKVTLADACREDAYRHQVASTEW